MWTWENDRAYIVSDDVKLYILISYAFATDVEVFEEWRFREAVAPTGNCTGSAQMVTNVSIS